jgi:hypothetical protein
MAANADTHYMYDGLLDEAREHVRERAPEYAIACALISIAFSLEVIVSHLDYSVLSDTPEQ